MSAMSKYLHKVIHNTQYTKIKKKDNYNAKN